MPHEKGQREYQQRRDTHLVEQGFLRPRAGQRRRPYRNGGGAPGGARQQPEPVPEQRIALSRVDSAHEGNDDAQERQRHETPLPATESLFVAQEMQAETRKQWAGVQKHGDMAGAAVSQAFSNED